MAAETGISVRYANTLLSAEGSSLERYILNRRLERCRRALEDPRHAHRTIGEIAFAWGFSDLSHFARRFKAKFGVSPGWACCDAREPCAAADRLAPGAAQAVPDRSWIAAKESGFDTRCFGPWLFPLGQERIASPSRPRPETERTMVRVLYPNGEFA